MLVTLPMETDWGEGTSERERAGHGSFAEALKGTASKAHLQFLCLTAPTGKKKVF